MFRDLEGDKFYYRILPDSSEYKSLIKASYLQKIAENTYYLEKNSYQTLFLNRRLNSGETILIYPEKDFKGTTLFFWIRQRTIDQGPFTLPYNFEYLNDWYPRISILEDYEIEVPAFSENALVKAVEEGGIEIRSTFESDRYIIGIIEILEGEDLDV